MSFSHVPDPPEPPPGCLKCGAPATKLLYVWLARTRWGVLGIGAPFSPHMRPKPGRLLEWVGICSRHRRRRLLAAMGVTVVAYVIVLTLWGVAFFTVDLKAAPVLAAGLFLGGALLWMIAMGVGVWLLTVIQVPSDGGGGRWASKGGPRQFPVEPEPKR